MSKPKKSYGKNARSSLYLVTTSSGWFACWNAETSTQTILSKDEKEAEILFQRMVNPPREKLPYRPSLSDQIDKEEKEKERKVPSVHSELNNTERVLHLEQERKSRTRVYQSVAFRLADPAVAAVMQGVTAHGGKYWRGGQLYPVSLALTEITGSAKVTSRIMALAWKTGLIKGERPRQTQSNNVSGHPGVSWQKSNHRWYARITRNGKDIHLGYFENKFDAIQAREAAKAGIPA
jgi:hypothetical protein